jgi:flavorubredoxin
MIDTGVPVHEHTIISQLRSLLPAEHDLAIFLSRSEIDSIGNVVAICEALQVTKMYTGGAVNPFDAMDQVSLSRGASPVTSKIARTPDREKQSVNISAERRLEIIQAPIRMISCFWSYDTGTRTLFTADFFGHLVRGNSAARRDDTDDARSLLAFTEARYWWLRGSRTPELIDKLDRVFSSRAIERIAPTHGEIIEGRDNVERHYKLMVDLLRELDVDLDKKAS